MAALVTFNAITDTMESQNIVVWKVLAKSGGDIIRYQHNDKLDIDSSIDELKKILNEVVDDEVKIVLIPNPNKGRGGATNTNLTYRLNVKSLKPAMANAPVAGYSDKIEKQLEQLIERNSKLEKQLIESKYEMQINELKKQIAGINQPTTIDRFLELVIPIATQYLAKNNPALAGMFQQVNPQDINGIDDNPVEKLAALDPDYLSFIDAVVFAAENNISQYLMYKKMLVEAKNNGK